MLLSVAGEDEDVIEINKNMSVEYVTEHIIHLSL